MNNAYIVPSNSKKQGLIFGFMKFDDLILFGCCALATFILFMIFPITTLFVAFLALLPLLIGGLLVFPVPNYHNVKFFVMIMFRYYFKDIKKYYWRGWCYQYEQPDK